MSTIPPIVLFGYDSSPFTQKIRLTLHLLRLPYTFAIVPSMLPRPLLTTLFSLPYRKIPILAIGREIYIDTSLIVEILLTDPRLETPERKILYPNAGVRTLSRLLSSFFTDRPLFRLTTGLIPASVWRSNFGRDRASLIGHELNADKLEQKTPRNLAGIDTYLSILEPLFACQTWFLGTEKPSLADLNLYYQLDWGEKMSRGEGVSNLTAGGATEGQGDGMNGVWSDQRYPGITNWFRRFKQYINSLESKETRIEGDDKKAAEKIVELLTSHGRDEQVRMLNCPGSEGLNGLYERIGWTVGKVVSIAPDDTGRAHPTLGRLVGVNSQEIVIEPGDGEPLIKNVKLHFPRVGFVIAGVRDTKL